MIRRFGIEIDYIFTGGELVLGLQFLLNYMTESELELVKF
jgi:hypothetical protein